MDFESETFVARAWALGSHAGTADGDQTNRCHASGGPVGSGISEELSHSLRSGRTQAVAHALRAEGFDASEDGTGRGTPIIPVAFSCKDHAADAGDLAPTLRAMGHSGSHANAGGQVAVMAASAVRRLMPSECEALQGFPRGFTAITYRGKPAADGNRYKALGNSMAVPVIRWILSRIEKLILMEAA